MSDLLRPRGGRVQVTKREFLAMVNRLEKLEARIVQLEMDAARKEPEPEKKKRGRPPKEKTDA